MENSRAQAGATSPRGAAALLGVSHTVLYRELAAGRLKSFKLGRRRLISHRAIAEFIDQREAETAAEHGEQVA